MNSEVFADSEIIDRILGGEAYLYEVLMRKYNLRLYRICMSIINDDTEAEDIMQTAYINAYLKLKDFRNRSSFSTWLTRILINESLLHKKKRAKREQLTEQAAGHELHRETPLNILMSKELKTILERAVADLPEKYRIVFVMREIEEMSVRETMEILDLGESNVKVRLSRAKEMLRDQLSTFYHSNQLLEFNLVRCDRVVNFVMGSIGI